VHCGYMEISKKGKDGSMSSNASPPTMTDDQIDEAVAIFRAQLNRCRGSHLATVVQQVLGQSDLGHELVSVFTKRIYEVTARG